jgi:PAS domain S-box-containing protein
MLKKYLFCILLLVNLLAFSQNNDQSFKHYTIDDGLVQSTVNCIYQDSRGYIWTGTQSGISKYNGIEFENFQYDLRDTNTISDNYVYTFTEDKNGNLWVATRDGLNKLRLYDEQITRYYHKYAGQNSISDNSVLGLYIDKSNILWLLTKNGLNRLDISTDLITTYKYEKETVFDANVSVKIIEDNYGTLWFGSLSGMVAFNKKTGKFMIYDNKSVKLSSTNITSIIQDNESNFWIGTENGLNYVNIKTTQVRQFFHLKDKNSIADNFITCLLTDKNKDLWIGSKNGLTKFRFSDSSFTNFTNDGTNPYSISSNYILSVFEDRANNLWIGTLSSGINKTDLKPKKIGLLNSNNGLSINDIASIYEDENKILWIGTWGGGLNLYNRKSGEVQLYSSSKYGKFRIGNDEIYVIFRDSKKRMWIGTKENIEILDPEKKIFLPIQNFYKECKITDRVNSIMEDKNHNIWIGTSNGLIVQNIENKFYTAFSKVLGDTNSINSSFVYSVYEDKDGIVWIGTSNGGLNHFDPKGNKFINYMPNPRNPYSISSSTVYYIKEIFDGTLVLGTANGLNFFNKNTGQFIYINKKMGLPDNEAYGFIEDNSKNLWISTNRGLSRYNIPSNTFKNYDQDDGLQSMEFNFGSFYKSKEGELFFGGIEGLNFFNPDKIENNTHIPPVLITRIKKNNFKGEQNIPLYKLENIVLTHRDYMLTIEFASLDFTNPEKNSYKYKLEGIMDDWVELGNRSFVTFSNLKPGDYVFHVTGSNNDLLWNEEGVTLNITVKPPYWKSTWAYIIYVLVILLFILWRIRAFRKEKQVLQKKVDERTKQLNEKNKELELQKVELEKLSIVASETSNAITIMDAEGNILWLNDAYCRMYGYSQEDFLKEKGSNLAQVSSNENIKEIIKNCIETKSSVIYDSTCTTKNGQKIWFQTSLNPILDKNNNIKNLVTIDTDITELKDAEEQIVNQKSEIEKAFNNVKLLSEIGQNITSNLFVEQIIDTTYKNVNELMDANVFVIGIYNKQFNRLDISGIDNGNRIPANYYELSEDKLAVYCFLKQEEILIADLKEEYAKYIKTITTPKFGEQQASFIYLPLIIKQKKIGIITVQSVKKKAYNEYHFNILKNLAIYVSIALDNAQSYFQIEDQKEKIEQTLKELQQTQSQLIQSEKMAALGQLIAGVAHEINTPLGAIKSSVGSITDTLNTELKKWPDFFKELSPEFRELFFEMLEISLKKDINISSREERKIKKEIITKLETQEIADAANIADVLVDTGIYDISEKMLTLLINGNSKDLLTMIYKMSGLYRYSQTIQSATDKASKIVFALKNFAHFDHTDSAVKSNIIDGIETVLTLYHNTFKHGIEVIKDYKEIPLIYCYPDELNQVWTNIVHNAIHAMKGKGILKVDVFMADEKNICVSMADDGCGIPPEIKDRIFDAFFTTKAQGEGSGLGLDIVSKIIERHHGKINVESVPGNTRFFVYLPFGK